jgi:hypothetical protein
VSLKLLDVFLREERCAFLGVSLRPRNGMEGVATHSQERASKAHPIPLAKKSCAVRCVATAAASVDCSSLTLLHLRSGPADPDSPPICCPAAAAVKAAKAWPTWGCEPSKFPWSYSSTETAYVVAGKVTVTPDGGEPPVCVCRVRVHGCALCAGCALRVCMHPHTHTHTHPVHVMLATSCARAHTERVRDGEQF